MRKMKKVLALLLAMVMVLAMLSSCGGGNTTTTNPPASNNPTGTNAPATQEPGADPTDAPEPTEDPNANWDGAYMDGEDFKAYICHDLEQVVTDMSDQLTDDEKTAVEAAASAGYDAINAAGTVLEVEQAYEDAYNAVLACVPTANGIMSFTGKSYEERVDMLALLETYAYRTGSAGLPFYENGGTILYNERLTFGTENYIPGYGFGILSEGDITEDLDYESNEAWKRYYHSLNASDPGTLNYLDDQGSEVGDFFSPIAADFFGTFMNDTKDGYVWVPVLAMERPVALNDDNGDGSATKWRFQIRTGKEGLKYTTGSTMESRAAFNNREVALEDYITGYKLLLTQSNGFYRGGEMANNSTGAIVGVKAFYDGTANGFDQALWDQVGIKVYEEDGKSYFEYEFTQEMNSFYAMYYIDHSGLCMPIPQEFIDLVTVQNYLGFNLDATETPVDNSLALGPYYLEAYHQDQEIVYKKNPNFVYADTKYAVPGQHIRIFPAMKEDPEAAFNEFLAGHTDACSIPLTRMNEYRTDPRAKRTTGDSVFKLNMNALNAEDWEYYFGENGVVTQTPKAEYWEVKPVLSNSHFRQGLMYSIDRLTFANARGSIPSVDYLASSYLWEPEAGLPYIETEQHQKVIEPLLAETDGYGYSLELAREYFRLALTELEAEGAYTPGTEDNPTVITIEVAWMEPSQEETYHNELKSFVETAFNDPSVTGGKYKLDVKFWVGNVWSDVYYNKMMVGQFDLGFGSVSGNILNPLDFMSVLSANQDISSGFTLNWGKETNDANSYPIVYEGQRYSYDAFYLAANSNAIVQDGNSQDMLQFNYTEITKNDDGSYTGTMEIKAALPDLTTYTVTQVVCCDYERAYYGDEQYEEQAVEFTTEDKGDGTVVVTFTVPADLAAAYVDGNGTSENPSGYTGFDFYYDFTLNGEAGSSYYSVYDYFVVE